MASSPFTRICIVRFVSSNNAISGKGLRPVQCVLLEQAMSPLYLSSSGEGGTRQTLHTYSNFRKKKKTLPSSLSCYPLPLKNLCISFVFFFFNFHILRYGPIAHVGGLWFALRPGDRWNGILALNGMPSSGPHLASNDKVSCLVMKALDTRERTGGPKGDERGAGAKGRSAAASI